MRAKTKILLVEHNPQDISQIQYELNKGQLSYVVEVVQTGEAYKNALRSFRPDIILSDYSLPALSGPVAFKIKEKLAPHVPFIFVSGTIGEENSIDFIRKGVTDFALKDKLFTLTAKVKQALKEAKAKSEKEKRAAELVIANKELAFQNAEKYKRAEELVIANRELSFQNSEKEKRANELIVANKELAFQNREKQNRADELVIANEELALQNQQKEKREEKRVQSEIRLVRAQQIAHMGSWELDFADNTVVWSDEACRICGIDPTDSKHSLDTCASFIHPDDLDFVIEKVKDSFSSLRDVSFHHRIVRKDGTTRYIYSESKFEFDSAGNPHSLYGIAHDVTDMRVAEKRAKFERSNLTSLINNTRDLMWSVDRNFKLITCNQAFVEIVKLMSGKIIVKGMDVLLPQFSEDQLIRYKAYYTRAFAGETFTEIEYSDEPAELWSAISYYPIRSGVKIIGTACHSHNITASKKAEREIRELNENLEESVRKRTIELTDANIALKAFSYSVSHDLRAPIRSIIGFSKLIGKDHGHELSVDAKELLSYIETGGKRMEAIISSLLTLAKSEKDKLNFEKVDVTVLCKKVWENHLFSLPHHATLELLKMPVVSADISMLEQVFVNLFSNAIKYSGKRKEPHIQVGYTETAEKVIMYVKDNGAGFDMEYYARLFGAFERLHDVAEFEGTGVGLTLVKRIVERHGGEIWAEGKVEEGATFYFSLPKKAQAA
jgi:PAS domain S-box-containing protein